MIAAVRHRLSALSRLQLLILAAFVTGAGLAASAWAIGSGGQKPAKHYSYGVYMSSGGVKLHAMKTAPDNIALKKIASNVTQTDDYGLNGGFFWNGDLLSIAVVDGLPLKGAPHDYGSGWYNIDVPKGTLVWDAALRRFDIQVVLEAGELKVAGGGRYWAQGGVSMSLQREADWAEQARKEDMPAFGEPRLRSGIAYDRQSNVWLLASDKPCTAALFRDAVKEVIAPGLLVDGLFLDGDGSTQMKNGSVALKGDQREVYQMVALKQR